MSGRDAGSMKLGYLAGPFRGPNSWDIEENIRRAERLALAVWRLGAACICPHTNTRFFHGAADDQMWLDGNLEIVRRCDFVLMTHDWRRSAGASAERLLAEQRGIPVFFDLPTLAQWLGPPKPQDAPGDHHAAPGDHHASHGPDRAS